MEVRGNAEASVDRVVAMWQEKLGVAIKPPANSAEAVVYAQVRDCVAAVEGKMSWLQKNGKDPVVASAILSAPGFVSGLGDTEIAFVKDQLEQHLAPQIVEEKTKTLTALAEAERGWKNAIAKIGQRAGLIKGRGGA